VDVSRTQNFLSILTAIAYRNRHRGGGRPFSAKLAGFQLAASSISPSVPARLPDWRFAASVSVPCAVAFGTSCFPPERPAPLVRAVFFAAVDS